MSCYLLHMVEQPDPQPYADPNLKDLVGGFPRFYCANCNPPQALPAGDVVKCMDREAPCWKPRDHVCD